MFHCAARAVRPRGTLVIRAAPPDPLPLSFLLRRGRLVSCSSNVFAVVCPAFAPLESDHCSHRGPRMLSAHPLFTQL